MQIDPIGKKANLLVSLAMSTGSSPQDAIDTVRKLEVIEKKKAEVDLGSVFFNGVKGNFDAFFSKTGKLVLRLLEENINLGAIEIWEGWSDNFRTSLRGWFPDKAFEERFSKLVDLPLHSWAYYEELITQLERFTRPSQNAEEASEHRELECKLIDYSSCVKPYTDTIFTREVGLQITTYGLKEGGSNMIFPKDPFETAFYNVTISKFEKGRWDFARIVYNTNDKEIARKIHEMALVSSRERTPGLVANHLGNSKFNDLIHNVIYGNH